MLTISPDILSDLFIILGVWISVRMAHVHACLKQMLLWAKLLIKIVLSDKNASCTEVGVLIAVRIVAITKCLISRHEFYYCYYY